MQEDTGHWRGNGVPTAGELYRLLQSTQQAVADLTQVVRELDKKLDERALSEVQHRADIAQLKLEVGQLKSERTWLWRAVATSAFGAIASLTVGIIVWLLNR